MSLQLSLIAQLEYIKYMAILKIKPGKPEQPDCFQWIWNMAQ